MLVPDMLSRSTLGQGMLVSDKLAQGRWSGGIPAVDKQWLVDKLLHGIRVVDRWWARDRLSDDKWV